MTPQPPTPFAYLVRLDRLGLALAAGTPDRSCPSVVQVVADLPKTQTGKIRRNVLRDSPDSTPSA